MVDVTAAIGNNRNWLRSTNSDSEDSGGAAGFSIADTSLSRARSSVAGWSSRGESLKIGVNGAALRPLVSAPEVVFVGEGETVSVRLGLAQEVTGAVPVTVASSDPSRFKVNHPRFLHMAGGRRVQTQFEARGSNAGRGTRGVDYGMRRLAPAASISFSFDAQDWAGYGPGSEKGFRVVEVTAARTGAGRSPDAVFDLVLSSSDPLVVFPSIKVVVQRGLGGLDPLFTPNPLEDVECRLVKCLGVVEGGSVQYTVRNFNVPLPGSPLTITPTGEGLSFDPAVVSWTSVDDYDEPRTVTVTADEDADRTDETVVISHSFSDNWDTNGWLSKLPGRRYSRAQSEARFDMAVAVQDDDGFTITTAAIRDEVDQVNISSRPGLGSDPLRPLVKNLSGRALFQVKVDQPPVCNTRRREGRERNYGTDPIIIACDDFLDIELRTRNPDGTYTNAPVTAVVSRVSFHPVLFTLVVTKLGGPGHSFSIPITPDNWNQRIQVQLYLDPSLVDGSSSGDFDISVSLRSAGGEPTVHRTLRTSYGPDLTVFPVDPGTRDPDPVDPDPVDPNTAEADDQQVEPQQQQQQQAPQQQQPQQDQPLVPVYRPDPQVVAAVQYLASQTHHGFAHVNRWQRALAAIGALDPADVTGGALTLTEARHNTKKYSSPVWDQVVAEIQAKQTHDTQQPQPQQQDQPQQDQPQQDQPQQDQPQQDQPQQDQPQLYVPDPQVVAAVQYLASQTHHGFAHVNRWQRALAALGVLDPADVTGGALTLTEAKQNTNKYSSPVWDQVVAEIEAKQAHDTAQPQ